MDHVTCLIKTRDLVMDHVTCSLRDILVLFITKEKYIFYIIVKHGMLGQRKLKGFVFGYLMELLPIKSGLCVR